MVKSNKKKSLIRPKYELGTEDPIDPITGLPIKKGLEDSKNIGINVFKNAENSLIPINPNLPSGNQMFKIEDQKNDQNPQSSVIPLSQIYNKYVDKFGNKQLSETGSYVDNKGQTNTLENQKSENNQISFDNLVKANRKDSNKEDVEISSAIAMTAINEYFNKKQQGKENRKNDRIAIMQEFFAPVVNPYAEGTGSQAIMKKGGKVDGSSQGITVTDGGKVELISSNNHSNPMVEFSGKEHKDGGIGIVYGNKTVEVENKEVGWVDNEGALNVFGKLKIPGSNETFKTAAKNIAKAEEKIDGMMSKYTNILNNSDSTNKYQETAYSTAKVMFKSLDKQSKEIADKKQSLASYQSLILNLANASQDKMEYGGRVEYEEGGKLDPTDPKSIQAIIDKYSGGKAPLKAEDFIEVSQKYGVPLDLMLAQAIQESSIGTKGMATKSYNIFNVKNNGNTGRMTNQGSWKQGLETYAKLLKEEYTTDGKTVDVSNLLSTNFKRPKKGGYYAEEKGQYTDALRRLIGEINPDHGYSFTKNSSEEDPYPKTFNQFKDKKGVQYNSPAGLSPSAFYKDASVVSGLKADQTYPKAVDDANWGPEHQKLWESLPQSKKDELLQKSTVSAQPQASTQPKTSGVTTSINSLNYIPKYDPIDNKVIGPVNTPYGPANREASPFTDGVNITNNSKTRGYQSPLAFEQIAPELITMATNKQEPVQQLTYQPDLQQTFDLSYQLGRNENQSTFNQQSKIAEQMGSVEALSLLAAQKYKADEAYNMQEVQGNATQKLGVYAQNINTLNDAKIKNLALISDQQNKQAAAKFNTRKEDIGAFTSISGKVLQNKLENKTYNAYANLFQHYGFDKKGNITFEPDKVAQKFTAGEALQFGMLSAQQGANAIMNGDFSRQFRKVKNEDGSTTTTETLGTNKKIQEEYKSLKNQGFDDNIIGNMLRAKYPETINQD